MQEIFEQEKKSILHNKRTIQFLIGVLVALLLGLGGCALYQYNELRNLQKSYGDNIDQDIIDRAQEIFDSLPDVAVDRVSYDAESGDIAVTVANNGKTSFEGGDGVDIEWAFVDAQGGIIGDIKEEKQPKLVVEPGKKTTVVVKKKKQPEGAAGVVIFVDGNGHHDAKKDQFKPAEPKEKNAKNNAFAFDLKGKKTQFAANQKKTSSKKGEGEKKNTGSSGAAGQSNTQPASSGGDNNAGNSKPAGSSGDNSGQKTPSSSGNAGSFSFPSAFTKIIDLSDKAHKGAVFHQAAFDVGKTLFPGGTDGKDKNDNEKKTRPAPQFKACYWKDSDGGLADNVKGSCHTAVPDAPWQKSISDYCKDAVTLVEYTVNNSCGGCDATEITCKGFCSEGRCVRPAPQVNKCYWEDTDGGVADNIKGSCQTNVPDAPWQKSISDYCKDDKTLVEYSLKNNCGGCASQEITCAFACEDGRCVRPAPQVNKCYWEDTDGGVADNVKGTCQTNVPDAPYQKAITDYCKDDKTLVEYSVNSSCSSCDSKEITCAFACEDGRCVRPAPTFNKCYWEDTDGGFADNIKGSCQTNVPGAPYQKSITDYCLDDKTLVEYEVNNSCGGCDDYIVTCDYACEDGRCVRPAPGTQVNTGICEWSDTDNGYNEAQFGACQSNNENAAYKTYFPDYCKDDKTLIEYEVADTCEEACVFSEITCDYACSEGRCVRPAPGTIIPTEPEPEPVVERGCQLTDTDGGFYDEVSGSCGGGSTRPMSDYCKDANTLVEYELDVDECACQTTEVFCGYGCDDGACLPLE